MKLSTKRKHVKSICLSHIFIVWHFTRKLPVGNSACWRLREDLTQCSHTFWERERHTQRWGDTVRLNKWMTLILRVINVFLLQQAEKMIQNVFSSFKYMLHELKWTDPESFQKVMEKVTCKVTLDKTTFCQKLNTSPVICLCSGWVFSPKAVDEKQDLQWSWPWPVFF